MSGSVSGLDAGSILINTLYGIGTSSQGTAADAVQALKSAEKSETKDVAQTAKQPAVQHDVAAFTKAVNAATTVAQLLANPAVMKVLLTANGLGDQLKYTALAAKVLSSNLKAPKSLANTLTDTRWKTLATTYNFAANGLSALKKSSAINAVAQGYAQVTWQNAQDTTTPGLSKALAFKASASTIKTTIQILGDPVMRDVVTTTLGIPKQIAFQSLDAQQKAIDTQIDIKQFQDPHFVESFVQRYLIANNAAVAAATTTPDLITLAIQGQGVLA